MSELQDVLDRWKEGSAVRVCIIRGRTIEEMQAEIDQAIKEGYVPGRVMTIKGAGLLSPAERDVIEGVLAGEYLKEMGVEEAIVEEVITVWVTT